LEPLNEEKGKIMALITLQSPASKTPVSSLFFLNPAQFSLFHSKIRHMNFLQNWAYIFFKIRQIIL
jgi:hypothetical protein